MKRLTVLEVVNDYVYGVPGEFAHVVPLMRRVRFEDTGETVLISEAEYVNLTLDGDYDVQFDYGETSRKAGERDEQDQEL